MRILHVVHQFLPEHRYGAEISTYELARLQQDRGHQVFVAAGEHGRLDKELSIKHDRFHDLRVTRIYFNPQSPDGWLAHDDFALAWRKLLNEIQPDIIHIQQTLNLSLSLIDESKAAGVPILLTLRDFSLLCARINLVRGDGSLCRQTDLEKDCLECLQQSPILTPYQKLDAFTAMVRANVSRLRSWKLLITLLHSYTISSQREKAVQLDHLEDFRRRNKAVLDRLEKVDTIMAISHDTAERFSELAGGKLRVESLHQVPDISRCVHRIRSRKADNPLRVGYIGKITYVKGVHVLLRAFRMLPSENATLDLYGSPTRTSLYEMAYWRRVQAMGDTDNIIFHSEGFDPNDIADVFDKIDVLVVPSVWFEVFGRVIIEALASGVPVICSDEGGPAELIEDGVNGFTFPIGDHRELAGRLNMLLDRPELLEKLSRNAHPPKTLDVYVDQVMGIYHELINGS